MTELLRGTAYLHQVEADGARGDARLYVSLCSIVALLVMVTRG